MPMTTPPTKNEVRTATNNDGICHDCGGTIFKNEPYRYKEWSPNDSGLKQPTFSIEHIECPVEGK